MRDEKTDILLGTTDYTIFKSTDNLVEAKKNLTKLDKDKDNFKGSGLNITVTDLQDKTLVKTFTVNDDNISELVSVLTKCLDNSIKRRSHTLSLMLEQLKNN